MKWPLIPRSVHDDVVSDLRKRLDDSEKARADLTETIIEMKVAGGSIPRSMNGERLEQRPRDEFEKAVDENPRCQADGALRRQQLRWAREAVAKGSDKESVLARLRTWGMVLDDNDG